MNDPPTPKPITESDLEDRIRQAFGSPIQSGTRQVIRVERAYDPDADDLFWQFQHQIDADREYQFTVEEQIALAQKYLRRITLVLALFMTGIFIVAAFWK